VDSAKAHGGVVRAPCVSANSIAVRLQREDSQFTHPSCPFVDASHSGQLVFADNLVEVKLHIAKETVAGSRHVEALVDTVGRPVEIGDRLSDSCPKFEPLVAAEIERVHGVDNAHPLAQCLACPMHGLLDIVGCHGRNGRATAHTTRTVAMRPAPAPASEAKSRAMSAQRVRDTQPEMVLRRELHGRGLRYLVDAKLPMAGRRKCDLLLRGSRVAVFVDSCFWHACPQHGTWPKENADWWRAKLLRNRERDVDTDERLRRAGWLPVRVWEHEDATAAADRVEAIVRGTGA
jgi:DNA mismatch endonuclease (patch repair protein)